jgi:3-(3-hydroxy-phenyl)propionate hydroxylase
MIGETGPWKPLWITIYKANALTLERYRHGRVLFAGDAAHLVPIFGVRGANSAIDDADNLAWKLAYVVRGLADAALLDSYSEERVFAAHENLASGMKSTEFMAPPTFAFKFMREAVLNLAVDTPAIRSLINPRQTSTISYRQSILNAASSEEARFASGPPPGTVLSNAALLRSGPAAADQRVHLTDTVRPGEFLILHFSENGEVAEEVRAAAGQLHDAGIPLRLVCIARRRPSTIQGESETLLDTDGTAFALYDAEPTASYLVRPDGHVAGRWRTPTAANIEQAVRAILQPSTSHQSKP